ncbi:TIGR02996 domain-containing protein [Zavarzinella formosa]|uniref:TIGR02996 domain-containing protein n=1 Tax=Zavarzinella formosa TaxID=360055 RepID=UPI00037CC5CB|nr:TIGR02996 domain-containing protein [Zavarzinella formosa]
MPPTPTRVCPLARDYLRHPEYLSLLETVRTFPHDDAPRLILADWIQFEGDHDARGEFIRAQIRRFRLDPNFRHGSATDAKMREAIAHECRLFIKNGRTLTGGDLGVFAIQCDPSPSRFIPVSGPTGDDAWQAILHRGFVSEIRMPCRDFMERAGELFAIHPISHVMLTDKQPAAPLITTEAVAFYDQQHISPNNPARRTEPDDLPTILFKGLEFSSVEEPGYWKMWRRADIAMEALSRRCVAHGRELAGLAPLPDE